MVSVVRRTGRIYKGKELGKNDDRSYIEEEVEDTSTGQITKRYSPLAYSKLSNREIADFERSKEGLVSREEEERINEERKKLGLEPLRKIKAESLKSPSLLTPPKISQPEEVEDILPSEEEMKERAMQEYDRTPEERTTEYFQKYAQEKAEDIRKVRSGEMGIVEANIKSAKDIAEATATTVKETFYNILEMIDQQRALLSGSDTKRIKEARNQFEETKELIKNMKKLIDEGYDVSQADIEEVFRRAYLATANIERTSKRKSITNIRYWNEAGRRLEIEAQNNYATLRLLRNEILTSLANQKLTRKEQEALRRAYEKVK